MTNPSFVAALCFLVPSTAAAQFTRILPSNDGNPRAPEQPTAPADDKPSSTEPEYYTPSVEEEPATPRISFEGLEISLGFGDGTPMGDMVKGTNGDGVALSDSISRQIPLSFGLAYRTGPIFAFGIALAYAPLTAKNCDSGSSCSANDFRVGIEGRLHSAAQEPFDPWLSFGVGYEVLNLSESGNVSGGSTLNGFDLDFQLGGDIRIGKLFALGPFIGLRVGNYRSVSVTSSGAQASADIPEASQATHGWLTFGLRGSFSLMKP